MLPICCKWKSSNDAPVILHAVILFLCLLVVNVFLQVANNSYVSDFGAHPDEGAHVVTSLMVRDYLAGGFLESSSPVAYAKSYYAIFPKVAIGHYPPLFYVIAGGWLLFAATVESLLLFAALLTSLCGLVTFMLGRLFMARAPAFAAALTFTGLPLTQQYTSLFMSDMMLLAGCLLSAAAFTKFMRHGRRLDSFLFGCWATIAILTKSSGLLLAFVPGLALLLARSLHLLKGRTIWLAPIVVMVVALPWSVFTYNITVEGVMNDGVGRYIGRSLPFFSSAIVEVCGVVVLGLACLQVMYRIVSVIVRRKAVTDAESVIIALFISGFCFYLLVPAGLEERYLLVIMPSVVLLAFKAIETICFKIVNLLRRESVHGQRIHLCAVIVLSASICIHCFALMPKEAGGFSEIINVAGKFPADNGKALLIVSDARGEGAIIAASALASPRRPDPGVRVYRGSKVLASSDWLGRNYKPVYDTVEGLRLCMSGKDFQFLAVDQGVPSGNRADYHMLVRQLVSDYPGDFKEVARIPAFRRGGKKTYVILYRIAVEGSG
jgi:hypothetical protein